MEANSLTQSPFAVLTFVVAPALLTNATSVLAMSTINRMLRARERMQALYDKSEVAERFCGEQFVHQVNRVERQAVVLLGAMRYIYLSLGAFAAATLVTLIGAVLGQWEPVPVTRFVMGAMLLLGFLGVAGLIGGCVNLFEATRLSMLNIREEAELIRQRQEKQRQIARPDHSSSAS